MGLEWGGCGGDRGIGKISEGAEPSVVMADDRTVSERRRRRWAVGMSPKMGAADGMTADVLAINEKIWSVEIIVNGVRILDGSSLLSPSSKV